MEEPSNKYKEDAKYSEEKKDTNLKCNYVASPKEGNSFYIDKYIFL